MTAEAFAADGFQGLGEGDDIRHLLSGGISTHAVVVLMVASAPLASRSAGPQVTTEAVAELLRTAFQHATHSSDEVERTRQCEAFCLATLPSKALRVAAVEAPSSAESGQAPASAADVLPLWTVPRILEGAMLQARERQNTISIFLGVLALSMMLTVMILVSTDLSPDPADEGQTHRITRYKVYGILSAVAAFLFFQVLHPVENMRPIAVVGMVLGVALVAVVALAYLLIWGPRERDEFAASADQNPVAYAILSWSSWLGFAFNGLLATVCVVVLVMSPRLTMWTIVRRIRELGGATHVFRGVFDLCRTVVRLHLGFFVGHDALLAISFVDHAVNIVLGVLLPFTAVSRATHALVARLRSRYLLAPIAPLLGFGTLRPMKPHKVCAAALRTFEPVVLGSVDRNLSADRNESQRLVLRQSSSSSVIMSRWATAATSGGSVPKTADWFVLASDRDGVARAREALARFANVEIGRTGRFPSAWFADACANMALDAVEQLAHEVVYMSQSRRLVVIWGSRFLDDLRCIALLWAWRAMFGSYEDVHVLVPVEARDEADRVVAAVDAYSVRHHSRPPEGPLAPLLLDLHRQLVLMVDLAGAKAVNAMVWSFLPAVAAAAEEGLAAAQSPSGDAVAPMPPLPGRSIWSRAGGPSSGSGPSTSRGRPADLEAATAPAAE